MVKLNPPYLLSFTWSGDSVVTFELERKEDQTRLILTHRNLGKDKGKVIGVCSGWHTHLNILSDRLEGLEPKGFGRSAINWRRNMFGRLWATN